MHEKSVTKMSMALILWLMTGWRRFLWLRLAMGTAIGVALSPALQTSFSAKLPANLQANVPNYAQASELLPGHRCFL
jgi:hypothetical protein